MGKDLPVEQTDAPSGADKGLVAESFTMVGRCVGAGTGPATSKFGVSHR